METVTDFIFLISKITADGDWQKGIVIHSSILAWKIPWTEEPGRLRSVGSQRVGHVMAAITICSDFGAQENEIRHCFHFFPIYLP